MLANSVQGILGKTYSCEDIQRCVHPSMAARRRISREWQRDLAFSISSVWSSGMILCTTYSFSASSISRRPKAARLRSATLKFSAGALIVIRLIVCDDLMTCSGGMQWSKNAHQMFRLYESRVNIVPGGRASMRVHLCNRQTLVLVRSMQHPQLNE